MTPEQIELLLIEWGALAKYVEAKSEAGSDFHVLQRARDFAPGTREKAAAQLVGRDGSERRRMHARKIAEQSEGKVRMEKVPMWAVDPVAGKTTRKATPPERIGDSIPPRLKAVHAAALELYRVDKIAGLVLRQEYCAYGSQGTKAERVAVALEVPFGVRMYREALARAMGWMHARMLPRNEAA